MGPSVSVAGVRSVGVAVDAPGDSVPAEQPAITSNGVRPKAANAWRRMAPVVSGVAGKRPW
jgi:hypothetical protein